MSVKVTIGESKTQSEKPFPKLMKSSDPLDSRVVWATGKSCGRNFQIVYVFGFQEHLIGTVCDDFSLFEKGHEFTDFNEPITLQNA